MWVSETTLWKQFSHGRRRTMMDVRASLLVLLTGCGFSVPGGSVISDSDGSVGDADSEAGADASTDGAANDAPANLDSDNDTILDALDNCPTVANTDQRNHDADPRGDVCDRCPHLASTTDPDGDNDGVGDACDPRPTTAGDQAVLFTGFYSAADTTGWLSDGTWTYDGATARQTNSSGFDYLSPPGTFTRASVQARVVIDTMPRPNGNTSAVILVSGSTGPVLDPTTGHLCALTVASSPNVYGESRPVGTNPGTAQSSWSESYEGVTIAFDQRLIGTHQCILVRNATRQATTSPGTFPAGRVTLVSQRSAIRFDYLFIVETGS